MPRRTEEPLHPLSILLLKRDVAPASAALKEPGELQKIPLVERATGWELFIRHTKQKEPPWASLLNDVTLTPLPPLVNASTAAVLFVPAKDRTLAYCFGHGRAFLRTDSYEMDFGLKVALNSIDAKKLRSLDSKTFEQLTVQTRRQSSKATSLQTFGLDITHDLLRAVTGEPRNQTLGVRLSGRDALFMSTRTRISDLGTQAMQLLELRDATSYRENFAWVDELKQERDSAVVESLNQDLLRRLWAGDCSSMHIAPPEILDMEHIRGFSFNSDQAIMADPDVDAYLSTVRHREALLISTLKRHELHLYTGDSAEPTRTWSVYQSLIVETWIDDKLYILSEGDWYAAATSLVDGLTKFMAGYTKPTVSLPPCKTAEDEKAYNARIATDLGWVLTDRELAKAEGARTPIEFCDLFTPERQIVHVKHRASSSTLSHLFAQGYVSAETFLSDREFRIRVAEKVGTLNHLIPVDEPNSRDFEVVFAIIGGERRNWPHSLPFFSQLHFKGVAEKLRRFGYGVSLVNALRI